MLAWFLFIEFLCPYIVFCYTVKFHGSLKKFIMSFIRYYTQWLIVLVFYIFAFNFNTTCKIRYLIYPFVFLFISFY